MLMTSGTVVGGPDDDRPFELEPDEENALLEAIGQADRGEVVSAEELLRELGPGA